MTDPRAEFERLLALVADTPLDTFEAAGGFAMSDEIAVALDAKWRQAKGPIVIGNLDLAWLLDGYARARLAALTGSSTTEGVA